MRKIILTVLTLFTSLIYATVSDAASRVGPRRVLQAGPAKVNNGILFATHEDQPVGVSKLVIFYSDNGLTNFINTNATYPGGHACRDPSLLDDTKGASGKLWLGCTNVFGAGTANTTWDLAVASNGPACVLGHVPCAFTLQQAVTCSPTITGASANLWGPKWFVDPVSKSVNVLISGSNSGLSDTNFQIYQLSPTDRTGFTTWSGCTVMTGTSFPNNMLDASVMPNLIGGKYVFWFKDENTKYLEYATSTSPFSGYTIHATGDWAGWGANKEAPFVTPIYPYGTNDYRIYFTDFTSYNMYYSDSHDQFQTWTAKANTGTPWFGGNDWVYRNPNLAYTCADAEANFYARLGTQPTTARKALYHTLICSLFTAKVWGKLDALYILSAFDAPTALTNLVSANYTLTTSGTITFSVDHGYTGNGTTGYLDTGLVQSTAPFSSAFSTPGGSLGAYVLSTRSTGADMVEIGVSTTPGTGESAIFPWAADGNTLSAMSSYGLFTYAHTVANVSGLWMVTRTASNVMPTYHNGSVDHTDSNVANGMSSNTIKIAACTCNAGAVGFWSTDQISAAFIGGAMTSNDAAALSAAINTYMTALGINAY